MKKVIFFLLSVALVFNSAAQSRIIEITDSLKHLLAIAKEDTTKVNVLVQLAFFEPSYQHGLTLVQDGLSLAKKIKYKKGEADCLHQIANQFRSINNYTLAIHNYVESLKIKEHLDDPEGYSRSLAGIGTVYKNQGDYRTALLYFDKALEIQKKLKYNYRFAYTSSNIGETYEAMGEPDSALFYFQSSYAHFNSDRQKYQMIKALNGLGRVQSKMGNTELALSYYRMGTINAIAYDDSTELADNYLGISKLFHQSGKIDSSIHYAKLAIAVSQDKIGEVVVEANKLLFKLYLNKNDKEAIKYLSNAMNAKDSNSSAEMNLQIQNLLYNEQERQREIASTGRVKTNQAYEKNNRYQYIFFRSNNCSFAT